MSNHFALQITNQMITACKSYITEQGYETVWTQPQADVLRKLDDCIKLNEEYQVNGAREAHGQPNDIKVSIMSLASWTH